MVTIIHSMKAATKLTVTGLIVLFAASLPVTLFGCLWHVAMKHIPATETALRVAATVGFVCLGGWATFIAVVLASTLAVLVVTALSE